MFVAVIQLAPAAVKNKWALIAAVTSFVLIAILNVNTAYVILLFILLGVASVMIGSKKAAAAAEAGSDSGKKSSSEAAEGGESE